MTAPKTNYYPGSISFSEGWLGPRGDVGFFMVYDHEATERIINQLIADGRKITSAYAGLDGDWNCNSSEVYNPEDGLKDYTEHASSQWAAPTLIVEFTDGPNEAYPVWKRKDKTL